MIFAYALGLVNFLLIGALPRLFFKRGEFHLRWFVTGLPFFVAGVMLAGAVSGALEPAESVGSTGFGSQSVRAGAGGIMFLEAIVIIVSTIRTHEVPLALWHQSDDAPVEIITRGPYRYVRHPFYSSFLLSLVATLIVLPHVMTMLALLAGAISMSDTARKEEGRLLASDFGDEYAQYMARTGRFLPRFGSAPNSDARP